MADLDQVIADKTTGLQQADESASGVKAKVDALVKNSAQLESELQVFFSQRSFILPQGPSCYRCILTM